MKTGLKITAIAVSAVAALLVLTVMADDSGKTDSNTVVEEKTTFLKCGHTGTAEYDIPENCEGIAPSEAAENMQGSFDDFRDNRLFISKTNDGYCNKHFRTYLEDNVIKTEVAGTGEIISEYPTAPAQFSRQDKELLKSGIITDSPKELSALLEDFTS